MFIGRTQTRNRISGEPYTTHRLVHSARVGKAVKQTSLLNLNWPPKNGRHEVS